MHDQVGLVGGHLDLRRHVRHRQQDQLAAEDLLVARERLAAVAAEVEVRVKGHGVLLARCRAVPDLDGPQAADSSAIWKTESISQVLLAVLIPQVCDGGYRRTASESPSTLRTSSASREKPNTSKLAAIRSGVADLGMTTTP